MPNYAINHRLDWNTLPATEDVAQRDANLQMVNTDTTLARQEKRNTITTSL